MTAPTPNYQDRVQNQVDQFRHPEVLKKLPPIYKYWTQKHLAPIVNEIFGTRNFFAMYASQFAEAMARQQQSRRILSIGAGDCKAEVAIAKKLVEMQVRDFVIDCTDLSGVRLERGREHRRKSELAPDVCHNPSTLTIRRGDSFGVNDPMKGSCSRWEAGQAGWASRPA